MPNKHGTTPLNWAAQNGHASVCRLLLDPSQSEYTDKADRADNGSTSKGADVDVASALGDTAVSYVFVMYL